MARHELGVGKRFGLTYIPHPCTILFLYTGRFGGDGDHDILLWRQCSLLLQIPIGFRHSPESALQAIKTTGSWARTTVRGPETEKNTTQSQSTEEHRHALIYNTCKEIAIYTLADRYTRVDRHRIKHCHCQSCSDRPTGDQPIRWRYWIKRRTCQRPIQHSMIFDRLIRRKTIWSSFKRDRYWEGALVIERSDVLTCAFRRLEDYCWGGGS